MNHSTRSSHLLAKKSGGRLPNPRLSASLYVARSRYFTLTVTAFLAPCNGKGKTYTLEVVESNEDTSARGTVIKDLKKKTCYKACVKAFVNVDGEKVYVKSGVLIHCLTSGGTKTRTNPKSITVDKTKVTLAKGKSKQIKASVVKKDDSKKLLSESHSPSLRYKSSNRKVATVSKGGRILAKGKGTCKVYVIASNGARKAVTVRVK